MASYHFISAKVIVSVSEELLLLLILLPPPPIPAVGMSEWTDEEREAMAASVAVVKRIWAHTCALSLSLSPSCACLEASFTLCSLCLCLSLWHGARSTSAGRVAKAVVHNAQYFLEDLHICYQVTKMTEATSIAYQHGGAIRGLKVE